MSREPIKHDLTVRCSPQRAFDAYANQIAVWWPAAYTADASTFSGVRIEPWVGGAVVEEHHDGAVRHSWGEVTVWQPGERLSYTSTLAQSRDNPSEITLRFAPDHAGCRVMFEHGGWNERNQSDRAKFGDWPDILARFVAVAERGTTTAEPTGRDAG